MLMYHYTQLLPKNTCVMKMSNNKSQTIICTEKSFYLKREVNVHSSIIYNSQVLETA